MILPQRHKLHKVFFLLWLILYVLATPAQPFRRECTEPTGVVFRIALFPCTLVVNFYSKVHFSVLSESPWLIYAFCHTCPAIQAGMHGTQGVYGMFLKKIHLCLFFLSVVNIISQSQRPWYVSARTTINILRFININ